MRGSVLLALVVATAGACRGASVPAQVFAPWDGTWEGRFWVRDAEGRVLTTLEVRQTYRSTSDRRQEGRFEERDVATGRVTTARALNTHDGRSLRCEVDKSTGERVVHEGRWTGTAIEWSRSTDRAKERFLERVVTSTDGVTRYLIEGEGRYDGGPRLTFEGRYRRIEVP